MARSICRSASACTVALVAALAVAAPSSASTTDDPPELLTLDDVGGEPDPDAVASATHTFEPERFARTFELDGRIESVETVETEGEDVTVTLASDVLFDPSSAELSTVAAERVGELVAEIPDGENAQIDGHTDSVDREELNQELSERRAQAVADAIAETRPDLTLEVTGYGESRLKQPEDGDDVAEDRAQNRRVEIRYTGTAPGESSSETETVDVAPVEAPYEPGDAPQVSALDPALAVAEQVVRTPGEGGGEVRVGVEELVVRGPLVRLRLQVTPLDPVPAWAGPDTLTEHISIYDVTAGELHETLVDTTSLTSYEAVSFVGTRFSVTDRIRTQTAVGRTMRYEAYFPRPVDDSLEAIDVSVVPTWPTFEDVPIRGDG